MGVGGWSETSLHLGHRIFGALPILYITGFIGRKMDKFIPDRKNGTTTAIDKPINNWFSPNIRTENVVSFHPISLNMKYRFEKFVIKFLCLKVFGRLSLSQCLYCYSRKFFLKRVFKKFQFKVAMCFQSSGINELMDSFMVDIRNIQFLLKSHRDQTWLQILQSSLMT